MLKVAPKYGNWRTKEQRHRGTEESICWHATISLFADTEVWSRDRGSAYALGTRARSLGKVIRCPLPRRIVWAAA